MVLTPEEAANKVCCNEISSMKKCLTFRCMAWKEYLIPDPNKVNNHMGPPNTIMIRSGKGYCGLTQK